MTSGMTALILFVCFSHRWAFYRSTAGTVANCVCIGGERKEIRQEMRRRKDLEVHRESLRKRKALRK